MAEIALFAIAGAVAALCLTVLVIYLLENRRSVKLEGRFYFDTRRIVWRVVNTGRAPVNVVEIGLSAGGALASYRPLFAMSEEINLIPNYLIRGDVGNYRKELDRFAFKTADLTSLREKNPKVYFYVKDACGHVYRAWSGIKLLEYAAQFR